MTQINPLILDNQSIVIFTARKWASFTGSDFNDLVQEGNIGLLRAASKYDPNRPEKFSTMAMPWVTKCIREFCMSNNTVKIPFNAQYKIRKKNKVIAKIYTRTGHDLRQEKQSFSHQKEIEDKHCQFECDQIDLTSEKEKFVRVCKSAKKCLNEREVRIIKYKFLDSLNYKEIGKKEGISKQRVMQVLNRAIDKIKEHV